MDYSNRSQLMKLTATFTSINFSDPELPDCYTSQSVANSLYRITIKPDSNKRAKIKNARKQKHKNK